MVLVLLHGSRNAPRQVIQQVRRRKWRILAFRYWVAKSILGDSNQVRRADSLLSIPFLVPHSLSYVKKGRLTSVHLLKVQIRAMLSCMPTAGGTATHMDTDAESLHGFSVLTGSSRGVLDHSSLISRVATFILLLDPHQFFPIMENGREGRKAPDNAGVGHHHIKVIGVQGPREGLDDVVVAGVRRLLMLHQGGEGCARDEREVHVAVVTGMHKLVKLLS